MLEKTQSVSHSYSYTEYKNIVLEYASQGKTSGSQLDERIAATLINAQRIKRIDKQCEIISELKDLVNQITSKTSWLLLAESWCGDGAQCIPVIAKIAELNPNIELRFIFRDENLDVMDSFLTNGSRSIPKLICTDKQTENIMGIWGPRPKAIQAMVTQFKMEYPDASHDELVKNIHLWYAKDKTLSIQFEFVELLTTFNFNG
jgi:hypothetical protein